MTISKKSPGGTRKLDLQVSPRMSRAQDDAVARLPDKIKRIIGVRRGGSLFLTTHKGTKIKVRVDDVHVEDSLSDSSATWVSQETFDLIIGNPLSKKQVTLGCDPEFVFLDKRRKIVPAHLWLPAKGRIGSDGQLAELRPEPGAHEFDVVENLRNLISVLPRLVKTVFGKEDYISAEGHSCWQNEALGFHIHVGAPRELVTYAAPKAKEFIRSFVATLDFFVGIPAMLLEDDNLRRLGDGIYGKPGDYRLTHHTIEYRTPGGFHLRHPGYAGGIMALALCISKQVMEDAYKESRGWRSMNEVAKFSWFQEKFGLPQISKIRWALSEPTKKEAVANVVNLTREIEKLRYFGEHSTAIKFYFRLLSQNKHYSPNLAENW